LTSNQATHEITENAILASRMLETQFDYAQLMHHVQSQTTQSAARLTESMTLFAHTMHAELAQINETATSLRKGMCHKQTGTWWEIALGWLWRGK
jgi:hypothetical protein